MFNNDLHVALQRLLNSKIKFLFVLFALLGLTACRSFRIKESSRNSQSESALSQALEKIGVDYPELNVGVSFVFAQDKNRSLFGYNEQKLFTPGSTTKLLTCAAALHYLGPHFRYDTEIYAEKIRRHEIHHLYLKASGDPSFSSSDIAKLIAELKQLGVRAVTGDIVVDASIFDDVSYGNGWMWNDLNEGFSAPVSGISVDHNRIAFGIFPGEKLQAPLLITSFPATRYFEVDNQGKTDTETSTRKLALSISLPRQHTNSHSSGIFLGSKVRIEGKTPLGSQVKYETLAIQNPTEFAAFLIEEELKKNGIAFRGKLRQGQVSSRAELITHHFSPPLSEMIIQFMKLSNNHATEMLLKSIGMLQGGAPGTFDKGIIALRQFLEMDAKVLLNGLVAADGSGLSRYNQISAKQLTDLLVYMWNNFQIGPEFISSLAIYGEDGTLKKGIDQALSNSLRAKTGSLHNIRSLAGYLQLDSGEVVAFAILTNGSTSKQQSQRQIIEDILTSLKGRGIPLKTVALN